MFMLGPTGWMTASKARMAEAQAFTENQRLPDHPARERTRFLPRIAGGALTWAGVHLMTFGTRLETVAALPVVPTEDHEKVCC